jgi:hypothetical protein
VASEKNETMGGNVFCGASLKNFLPSIHSTFERKQTTTTTTTAARLTVIVKREDRTKHEKES